MLALGENPFEVYGDADLRQPGRACPICSVTLQMMTPLLFTGLAVSIAFRAGLWNIGVEGQMLVGRVLRRASSATPSPLPACAARARCARRGHARRRAVGGHPGIAARLSQRQRARRLPDAQSDRAAVDRLSSRPTSSRRRGRPTSCPTSSRPPRLPNFSLYSQAQRRHHSSRSPAARSSRFSTPRTMRGFEWKIIGLNPRFAYYGGDRCAAPGDLA